MTLAQDCAALLETSEKVITTPGTNKSSPTKKQDQNTKLGKANKITPLKTNSAEPAKVCISAVILITE